MNLNHARDWFCEQNGIPNDVEVIHFENCYDHGNWASKQKHPRFYEKFITLDYGEAAFFPNIEELIPVSVITITEVCKEEEIFSALFHELVHWRQHYLGDLTTTRLPSGWIDRYWKGQWVHPGIGYMQLPWEKEAFAEMYVWAERYTTEQLELMKDYA